MRDDMEDALENSIELLARVDAWLTLHLPILNSVDPNPDGSNLLSDVREFLTDMATESSY